jgi:hypothetical protein
MHDVSDPGVEVDEFQLVEDKWEVRFETEVEPIMDGWMKDFNHGRKCTSLTTISS